MPMQAWQEEGEEKEEEEEGERGKEMTAQDMTSKGQGDTGAREQGGSGTARVLAGKQLERAMELQQQQQQQRQLDLDADKEDEGGPGAQLLDRRAAAAGPRGPGANTSASIRRSTEGNGWATRGDRTVFSSSSSQSDSFPGAGRFEERGQGEGGIGRGERERSLDSR